MKEKKKKDVVNHKRKPKKEKKAKQRKAEERKRSMVKRRKDFFSSFASTLSSLEHKPAHPLRLLTEVHCHDPACTEQYC